MAKQCGGVHYKWYSVPRLPLSLLRLAADGGYLSWIAEQSLQLRGCPLSKLIASTQAKHLVSSRYSMDIQHMFLFN